MKTVYADVVLITNFCIDYIVVFLSARFLYTNLSFFRMFSSSLFGSIYALTISVVSPVMPVRILLQTVSLMFMALIAFGKRRIRTYVKIIFSMYFVSLLFGGIVTVLISNMNISINGFTVILTAFVFCIIALSSSRFFRHELVADRINVIIENSGRMCKLSLMCDSGNLLVDPYNSLPVMLIDKNFKNLLVGQGEDTHKTCGIRLVPIKTVCGRELVEVFTPDNVFVCTNKKEKVMASVGFVSVADFEKENCHGILPAVLLNNH